MVVATHNGPFHADDVMAFALIRAFVDPDATVVRTRDPSVIDRADVAIDVGGRFDPDAMRFDHHQASYQGPRSSAGMVLDWLAATRRVDDELAARLRSGVVDYLDAVDTGRRAPDPAVPCFPRLVAALNHPADDDAGYDAAYRSAAAMAEAIVQGLSHELDHIRRARALVRDAMAAAEREGSLVLQLEAYVPWKDAYFEAGGADHPTAFVLHPATDGSWRVVAIPPKLGTFEQKISLPEPWAGLTDEALCAVTGVEGSVFCHKNRFIAVFKTRAGAVEAMRRHGLWECTGR